MPRGARMGIENEKVGIIAVRKALRDLQSGFFHRFEYFNHHRIAQLTHLPEAVFIIFMNPVYTASADIVVGMVEQKLFPCVLQEAASGWIINAAFGPGGEGFNIPLEQTLRLMILLLEIDPRGIDAQQNWVIGIAGQITGYPCMCGILLLYCLYEIIERTVLQHKPVVACVNGIDKLRKFRLLGHMVETIVQQKYALLLKLFEQGNAFADLFECQIFVGLHTVEAAIDVGETQITGIIVAANKIDGQHV